jgi:hypothetical protein
MSYDLINHPMVRHWMHEAYLRSNMGGLRDEAHLPKQPVTDQVLVSEKIRRLHAQSPRVQQEWAGLILRTPGGELRHLPYGPSRAIMRGTDRVWVLDYPPPELKGKIKNRKLGKDEIVGHFHTHPCPKTLGPSDADKDVFEHNPDAPPEMYVIDINNVWVQHWEREEAKRESVGSTRNLILKELDPRSIPWIWR